MLLLQGLMSTAIPWIFITWAEKYIDSALATVLNATVPLFTIVVAHIYLGDDRMTFKRVAGLLVGFSGVLVLVHKDLMVGWESAGGGNKMIILGQGAMLLSAAFYGISNVYARAKLRGILPIIQAFYTILLADAVMWVVTPVIERPFSFPVEWLTWVAIAWLGVLGGGVGYVIFYHLLHTIGPTRVAMVTYTLPVVGVTLGVVLLKEPLTWPLAAGSVLIVSGIWVVNRR